MWCSKTRIRRPFHFLKSIFTNPPTGYEKSASKNGECPVKKRSGTT
jgi:hypothetical protein